MHYRCNFKCVPQDSDYLASYKKCILLYMSVFNKALFMPWIKYATLKFIIGILPTLII